MKYLLLISINLSVNNPEISYRPESGLIFHSDRGNQYCSHAFQNALAEYGMHSSMSRKADCWDNAPIESL